MERDSRPVARTARWPEVPAVEVLARLAETLILFLEDHNWHTEVAAAMKRLESGSKTTPASGVAFTRMIENVPVGVLREEVDRLWSLARPLIEVGEKSQRGEE